MEFAIEMKHIVPVVRCYPAQSYVNGVNFF